MKKTILILFLSFTYFTTFAQRGDGKNKIKAYKIAFITDKLALTETQAAKFWPIYNKYEKIRNTLLRKEREEIKNKIKNSGGIEFVSDREAEKYLQMVQDVRKAQYDNKIDLHDNLIEFLPAKKILLLEIAEHEFNKRLMKRLQERRAKFRNRR